MPSLETSTLLIYRNDLIELTSIILFVVVALIIINLDMGYSTEETLFISVLRGHLGTPSPNVEFMLHIDHANHSHRLFVYRVQDQSKRELHTTVVHNVRPAGQIRPTVSRNVARNPQQKNPIFSTQHFN